MRRIYFLVPTVATARAIVDELLLKRIEEHRIHVIARKDTPLENLPAARLAQSSDIVTALQRGAAAGGLTGLLAGLAAVAFPPAGLVLGGGAALGMTLFGAGFGAWMSGMVGVGMPNSHIEQYQAAIESGELLVMIDLPRDRVEEIEIAGHRPPSGSRARRGRSEYSNLSRSHRSRSRPCAVHTSTGWFGIHFGKGERHE